MDPILQALIEILGVDIAQRVFRSQEQTVAEPSDEAVRQGAAGFPSELTLHVDQWQGPPCDLVDELYEDRLFDRLMEDNDCGCHSRHKNGCR